MPRMHKPCKSSRDTLTASWRVAHRLLALLLLLGALGLSARGVGAAGTTYTVTSLGDTGAGSGPTGDLRYVLTAVNAGEGGDTIAFAVAGTVSLTRALPVLTKDVTIAGPGADSLTISGNQRTRVLTIDPNVTVAISGLTIADGRTTDADLQAPGGPSGAGIQTSFSVRLTLTDCVVVGNVAAGGGGGGIYVGVDSVLSVERSVIRGNATMVGLGGGIDSLQGSVRVHASTIADNVAGDGADGVGGGIYSTGGVSIDSSTVSGNIAGRGANGRGGGVATESFHADLQITGSTLSDNTAFGAHGGGLGGGIYTSQPARATNSTLAGNVAGAGGRGGQGGAIYTRTVDRSHRTTLTNSTIARNTASDAGGGIAANYVAVLNTVVAGNAAPGGPDLSGTLPELSGALISRGHNLIGDTYGTTIIGADPTDLVGADPLLGPLGNYGGLTQTFPLLPGSRAIGGGDTDAVGTPPDASAPVVDQRGVARTGRNDIGAFQSQGFALAIVGGTGQTGFITLPFADPLVVIVTSLHREPVQGGRVSFVAPSSGPSAIVLGDPATIDGGGRASVRVTANGVLGGPYAVRASATGAATVTFTLSNTKRIPLPIPAP